MDAVRQDQEREKHEKLLGWISSSDFPAQQSDLIRSRQDGTGQWFLDTPEFVRWLHGSKETLFCPGIPGAGKTVIAAITIDYLLQEVRSNTIGVGYVYCSYKAQLNQSELLAAILKQLAQARPTITEPIEGLYKKHVDRGTRPSSEEILRVLQSVLSTYSSAYIVVDALDECPDQDGTRHQFLAKIRDLQSKTDLRLMATSRFIPDIFCEFSAPLTLEIRASGEDVKRFVAGQIHRLPKCIQRDDTLRRTVQDEVTQAADGMLAFPSTYCSSFS